MRFCVVLLLLLLTLAYMPAGWAPLPGAVLCLMLYAEMSRPT